MQEVSGSIPLGSTNLRRFAGAQSITYATRALRFQNSYENHP